MSPGPRRNFGGYGGRFGGRRNGFGRGGFGGSRGGPRNNGPRFDGGVNKNRFRNQSNYNKKNNKTKYVSEKITLNEVDAGLTEYLSKDLEGFKGILKLRYSDFHVNEIDMDGNVTKLTDLKIPKEPRPDEEDDDDLVSRYRNEHIPTETWDKLHKIVQDKSNEKIEIDVNDLTKEERTGIHDAVRTVFGKKIVGETVTKGEKKFITFKLFNKNDKSIIFRSHSRWPAHREGEYVYFLVHKQQTDTIEANIQISDALGMKPTSFAYAGVKDRRAKTTQWFCVKKVEPKRILEATKKLKNINIGNFCYKPEPLKLGQLKGNRFRIALREIIADDELIEKALVSLKENGFINYYGLQRFGNCKEIPTYSIGIELLKGNWAEAVNLILKPRKSERLYDVAEAKKVYSETGDANKALEKLFRSKNRTVEGRLIKGLAMHGKNDYVNALESVPRNMRLLYIHAYQSLVWNNMVSKRINEFGLKPIVGDLVVEDKEEVETENNWEFVETEVPSTTNSNLTQDLPNPKTVKVKILTEADLDKYTIYDVVLPLPGYDIVYPENIIKDYYKEFLEKDGLTLEMPKQKVKTYTLSGAYRKILGRVSDLSWEFIKYDDTVANLIISDIEELRDVKKPTSVENGKYKGLLLDFNLPSSSYATCALREIMKIDLSWHGNDKKSAEETGNETETDQKDSDTTAAAENTENNENPDEKGNEDGEENTDESLKRKLDNENGETEIDDSKKQKTENE